MFFDPVQFIVRCIGTVPTLCGSRCEIVYHLGANPMHWLKSMWGCLLVAAVSMLAAAAAPLPQTTLWRFPATIVEHQYRELRDFYKRQTAQAAGAREVFSHESQEAQRKCLRELTGAIDSTLPPAPAPTVLG
jgi:hypothetical protein